MTIYAYRNPEDESPLLGYDLPVWQGSRAESCIVDPDAISALDNLVVGPIENADTIVRAESAIRALIFHDSIHIIRPSVKRYYLSENIRDRFISNVAIGTKPSLTGISNVLEDANYREAHGTIDHLHVFENEQVEHAYVREAKRKGYIEITDSSHHPPRQLRAPANIVAVGTDETDYYENTFQSSEILIRNFLAPIPNSGLTAYLTNPVYSEYQSRITHQCDDAFFRSIDESWKERRGKIEDFLKIPMEPLLAIVLQRAKRRDDIPTELVNLRHEFADARRQFWDFVDDAALRTRPPERGWEMLEELQIQASEIVPRGLYSKHKFWPARFFWVGRLAWLVAIEDSGSALRETIANVLKKFAGPVNYVEMTPKLAGQFGKIDWETLARKHFSLEEVERLSKQL